METIKSYTDISQSKRLAEILPPESADMFWRHCNLDGLDYPIMQTSFEYIRSANIPCWSLTALLSVLPDEIIDDGDVYRNMLFHLKGKYIIQYPRLTTLWPSLLSVETDNPVDAAFEMILKLNELNLL